MKSISLLSLSFAIAISHLPMSLSAHCPGHDVSAAQQKAVDSKKDLMMVFSGKGWSGRSQKFEKEILEQRKFKLTAAKKFVTVVLDFPAKKKDAHTSLLELRQKYRFRQMPSVVLTDAAGRPYVYTGVRGGDVKDYLAHLDELHALRVERDRLFNEARKVNGLERAKLLVKALKALPQNMIRDFYAAELAEIASSDPKGSTGYVAQIERAENLRKEQQRYSSMLHREEFGGVLKAVAKESANLKGEDAQRFALYKIRALFGQKKYDQALKEVEAMKKIAPKSSLGAKADRYTQSISNARKRDEQLAKSSKSGKQNKKPISKRSAAPIVSKPIALVSDIKELREDAVKLEQRLKVARQHETELKGVQKAGMEKVAALKAEMKKLEAVAKADEVALAKAAEQSKKLAAQHELMKATLENHEAMERRKKEVQTLEKKAVDLQKEAEKLRLKAAEIKKGK